MKLIELQRSKEVLTAASTVFSNNIRFSTALLENALRIDRVLEPHKERSKKDKELVDYEKACHKLVSELSAMDNKVEANKMYSAFVEDNETVHKRQEEILQTEVIGFIPFKIPTELLPESMPEEHNQLAQALASTLVTLNIVGAQHDA